MVNVKEIKAVKLAPFTLMSSSIGAILAFIAAIIIFITFGTIASFIPQAQGIKAFMTFAGAALIIIYPISAFFISLAVNFFSVLLYNGLVSRLGGIKLGLDGNELTNIPVVSFALILASIEAIWAFIIGIFLTAAILPAIAGLSGSIPTISQAIANATNMTNATLPTGQALAAGGVFLAIFLIIVLPIIAFIAGFIGNALTAIFYNYVAVRVAKVQLNFTPTTGAFDLTSIPVVPAALSIAIVFAIWGFIRGLGSLASLSANGDPTGGVLSLIGMTVGYFILYFIITALGAIFYNYLAPRIGSIGLELE